MANATAGLPQKGVVPVDGIRLDGGTQPRDAIHYEWAREYAEEMQAGAVFPPVTVYFDGTDYWLADGFHRVEAARMAGLERIAADVREGTRRDAILRSVHANADHGHRRTNADKRRAALKLLEDEEWSQWSDREIARQCGVSHDFVNRLRQSSLSSNDSDTTTRTYTDKHGNISTMNIAQIGHSDYEHAAAEDCMDCPVGKPIESPEIVHFRARGTGENEWHTPPDVLDLVRSALGTIDLDPASSEVAQRVVQASEFFRKGDGALNRHWHGRVWLNPPYSQPDIQRFIEKLIVEYRLGRVSEAILLTHNYTDTAWFHLAAPAAEAICFTRGRIRFVSRDGELAAPTQGQLFFYFGADLGAFRRAFSEVGLVVTETRNVRSNTCSVAGGIP